MSRKVELAITLGGDVLGLTLAFVVSWRASGIDHSLLSPHTIVAGSLLMVYWLFLFRSANLYLTRPKIQLMNEIFRMLQVIVIGLIIIIAAAVIVNIDFIKL